MNPSRCVCRVHELTAKCFSGIGWKTMLFDFNRSMPANSLAPTSWHLSGALMWVAFQARDVRNLHGNSCLYIPTLHQGCWCGTGVLWRGGRGALLLKKSHSLLCHYPPPFFFALGVVIGHYIRIRCFYFTFLVVGRPPSSSDLKWSLLRNQKMIGVALRTTYSVRK